MNEIEKQILEEYAKKCGIACMSYKMMGMMLNEQFVEQRIKLFDIKHMYIYGGSYMAVQLYRTGKKYADVKGIVDKSRKIPTDDNIPVFALEEFKEIYNGEKVVITSVRYLQEIKKDIEAFVDAEDIINIGELLTGITEGMEEHLK